VTDLKGKQEWGKHFKSSKNQINQINPVWKQNINVMLKIKRVIVCVHQLQPNGFSPVWILLC